MQNLTCSESPGRGGNWEGAWVRPTCGSQRSRQRDGSQPGPALGMTTLGEGTSGSLFYCDTSIRTCHSGRLHPACDRQRHTRLPSNRPSLTALWDRQTSLLESHPPTHRPSVTARGASGDSRSLAPGFSLWHGWLQTGKEQSQNDPYSDGIASETSTQTQA